MTTNMCKYLCMQFYLTKFHLNFSDLLRMLSYLETIKNQTMGFCRQFQYFVEINPKSNLSTNIITKVKFETNNKRVDNNLGIPNLTMLNLQ